MEIIAGNDGPYGCRVYMEFQTQTDLGMTGPTAVLVEVNDDRLVLSLDENWMGCWFEFEDGS